MGSSPVKSQDVVQSLVWLEGATRQKLPARGSPTRERQSRLCSVFVFIREGRHIASVVCRRLVERACERVQSPERRRVAECYRSCTKRRPLGLARVVSM